MEATVQAGQVLLPERTDPAVADGTFEDPAHVKGYRVDEWAAKLLKGNPLT